MIFTDKFGLHYKCDFDFSGVNTLVLSGGALKCLYFLGALMRLRKLKFKYFAGTSCGAIVTTLLAVGYKPSEIFNEILRENFQPFQIQTALDYTLENIKELLKKKGFDPMLSFKQLELDTGKRLAFVTSNISKLKEEIFSVDTYPDVPIITGIKLSCSLPIIFPTSRFNNDIFIDGIFFDNFPLKLCRIFPNVYKVLAISTLNSHYDKRITEFYEQSNVYKIILIPDKIRKYFFASKEDKFSMFMSGYNFVDKNLKRKKPRRKSL